jgi:hypothetical protein
MNPLSVPCTDHPSCHISDNTHDYRWQTAPISLGQCRSVDFYCSVRNFRGGWSSPRLCLLVVTNKSLVCNPSLSWCCVRQVVRQSLREERIRFIVVVASLRQGYGDVYVHGSLNGKSRTMLVDTGATRTIVRSDNIEEKTLTTTAWRLRTTTGTGVNVHGEIDVKITMRSTVLYHRVLVAEIEEKRYNIIHM